MAPARLEKALLADGSDPQVNVVSGATPSRRSRLLYEKGLRPGDAVGMIRGGARLRSCTLWTRARRGHGGRELIAYGYARFRSRRRRIEIVRALCCAVSAVSAVGCWSSRPFRVVCGNAFRKEYAQCGGTESIPAKSWFVECFRRDYAHTRTAGTAIPTRRGAPFPRHASSALPTGCVVEIRRPFFMSRSPRLTNTGCRAEVV